MSETSFIGVLPTESSALLKVQELRNAGYEKEDIFIIKKHHDTLVVEHGMQEGEGLGDHIEEHFTDFIGGDDAVRKALIDMRFQDDEVAYYYNEVKKGSILLYVRR